MRKFTGGNGADTTAAVQAWLAANNQLYWADLILIGNQEFPDAIFMTGWETPLVWPIVGTFQPAAITRSGMKTAVGLEVTSMDLTWSPRNRTFVNSTNPSSQTSPLQLAQIGYYDNWFVRVFRCAMPTPGDANTFGATPWFGGRIAKTTVDRYKITFNISSFLEAVNQKVPSTVVENTNPIAGYLGALPSPGDATVAHFSIIAGSTNNILIARATAPSLNKIYGTNVYKEGYLAFDSGSGETLGGTWSLIAANQSVTIAGYNYNQFTLYSALPWPPTPGVDTFYASYKPPVDLADTVTTGPNRPFPFVPSPESAG